MRPMTSISVALLVLPLPAFAADAPPIRLNTIGFLPDQEKRASVAAPCSAFTVVRPEGGAAVFSGKASEPQKNADTGEMLQTADFSPLNPPGTYCLDAPGVGRSAPFHIGKDVYNYPFYVAMRGMCLWRCGTAVTGKHEGRTYAHEPCHMDDAWLDSVGGGHVKKPATKGWHDAGDYNKYVVNAGATVGPMLQAWEHFGSRIKPLKLDNPKTVAALPDYLDEIRFEMEWVLTMQADDGSVWHKLTTKNFGGFTLPEKETTERFFTPWSSAATADFVAMAAMASRNLKPFDAPFAAKCLEAALKSWAFLAANPANHKADLKGFKTGDYQTDDPDDRLWAAAEMWETTGDAAYLKDFETRARAMKGIDTNWDWGNLKNLGMFTYLLSKRSGKDPALVQEVRDAAIASANGLVATRNAHGYGRSLGTQYYWGCNGTVARQVVNLQVANLVAPNKDYVSTALDALGHLFGRNCHGRSYVTGLGANPPMFPHDRRSGGDAIPEPWPGYLVGGGWPKAADWVDKQESYQTNEIAINWNGALVYALAGFVEGAVAAPPAPAPAKRP